jgi:outer membrane protein
MKNLSVVLNSILVVAVVILFVLQFSSTKEESGVNNNEGQSGSSFFPLAYINTDSLLIKYEYAKLLKEKMLSKEEASRADFNEKAKIFQQDLMEHQRKLQNNGYLSLDRAQKEEQRLAKANKDLQDLNTRLTNELMAEQNKVNSELRDTLINYLKEYNKQKGYKVILSNTMGDNVLYSEPGVDITNDIVKALNDRYKAASEKK